MNKRYFYISIACFTDKGVQFVTFSTFTEGGLYPSQSKIKKDAQFIADYSLSKIAIMGITEQNKEDWKFFADL